jgi:adenylate cyclase
VKQHIVRIALGLAICLFFLGHTTDRYHLGFIDQLDNIIYDARLVLTMPRGVDDRIVILDIDEKSLQELGHWPWSRDLLAKVHRQAVRPVPDRGRRASTSCFAEADYSSGIRVLDQFAKVRAEGSRGLPAGVSEAAAAARQRRPVCEGDEGPAGRARLLPLQRAGLAAHRVDSGAGAAEGHVRRTGASISPTWVGYGGNLSEFQQSAANAGHFNPFTDPDGIVRRVPMIAELDGAFYEALSLAVGAHAARLSEARAGIHRNRHDAGRLLGPGVAAHRAPDDPGR